MLYCEPFIEIILVDICSAIYVIPKICNELLPRKLDSSITVSCVYGFE